MYQHYQMNLNYTNTSSELSEATKSLQRVVDVLKLVTQLPSLIQAGGRLLRVGLPETVVSSVSSGMDVSWLLELTLLSVVGSRIAAEELVSIRDVASHSEVDSSTKDEAGTETQML